MGRWSDPRVLRVDHVTWGRRCPLRRVRSACREVLVVSKWTLILVGGKRKTEEVEEGLEREAHEG